MYLTKVHRTDEIHVILSLFRAFGRDNMDILDPTRNHFDVVRTWFLRVDFVFVGVDPDRLALVGGTLPTGD